jgi:hypothetical protein
MKQIMSARKSFRLWRQVGAPFSGKLRFGSPVIRRISADSGPYVLSLARGVRFLASPGLILIVKP